MIPIMLPGDRFFRLFSQLDKFLVLNSFAIWASFYLHNFFFIHSRQIGEYLTSEFWDMDFFLGQEGRG